MAADDFLVGAKAIREYVAEVTGRSFADRTVDGFLVDPRDPLPSRVIGRRRVAEPGDVKRWCDRRWPRTDAVTAPHCAPLRSAAF